MESTPENPLNSVGEWEDDVLERCPEGGPKSHKPREEFRNYDDPARDTVREFYRLNHTRPTAKAPTQNSRAGLS